MAVALADTGTATGGGTNLTGRTGTSDDVDKGVAMPTAAFDAIPDMTTILDCLQRTVYPVLDQCYNLGGSVMNERGFLA